jgi:subtilisin family serine protease
MVEMILPPFPRQLSILPCSLYPLNLPAKIPAGQGIKTSIQFNGSGKGKFEAALTLLSDAKNAAKLTVPLRAEVISTPKMIINPENIHFELQENEIKQKTITLENNGEAELNYELSFPKGKEWLESSAQVNKREIKTTFAGGNGHKSNYFQINVKPSNGVQVTSMTGHFKGNGEVNVWRRNGKIDEAIKSTEGWEKVASANISSAGTKTNNFSYDTDIGSGAQAYSSSFPKAFKTDFELPHGENTLLFVEKRVGLKYTNGTFGKIAVKDENLTIFSGYGASRSSPSLGGSLFKGRIWNGMINYSSISKDRKGKLQPGKSISINLAANESKMLSEYEDATIEISSNDPDTPLKNFKVSAQKISEKGGLIFSPASLSFSDLFLGQTEEKMLTISNGNKDSVTINRFVFRDSAFSHRLNFPMTLKAGEKVSAKIYFTPKKAGEVKSSALLLTSEGNGKSISLSLSGSAIVAPTIALNPGSISQTLRMKEEKKVNLTIRNTGGSNLGWSFKGATTLGGKSFSLAEVFGMDHFIPLEKGAIDTRSGSTMSTTGGGPDHHGYSWSDSKDPAGPQHNWTDISKTGKLLTELSKTDDGFAKVALPFEVDFYGEKSKNVFVSSNGYLTFEEGSMEHGHFPLPSRMMPTALVSAFAKDLNPSRGGNIYYKTGQDELVVQYDRVKDFAGEGEYTFQIWLNRNGVIYFHYGEMNGPTNRATTGIQNFYGDVGLLVAYNNEQIKSDMTVRLATSPKWLHTSKNSGNLASGKSETIQLTLKAGEIMAGKYEAKIEVTSNDPSNPSVEIPVTLQIQATRTLSASPVALDFGRVEVGANAQLPLVLKNTGNAPVSLNGISANAREFSSNFRTTTIEPGKSEEVVFTFAPTRGQTYRNQATVASNAGNSPSRINLSGIGVATPKLSINPESLSITVEAGSKATDSVVIDNRNGLAAGTFNLKEIRSGATQSKSHFNEMTGGSSENIPADPFAAEHVPNELIVSFKAGKQGFDNAGAYNLKIKRSLASAKEPGVGSRALGNLNLALMEAEGQVNLKELAKELSKDGAVEYVEPNYILRHTATPNDPNLKSQWALPKMQASKAWEITKGAPSVVVAVIDTGIDYNHPDLQGNIWKNPGEIAGNRKDDDGNGFVDDVYGWDFANNDNDPMDGNRHGTHVAGTIAAATNNNKHVAGVAWQAKLVAVKFLSDGGSGSTADAIDSIAYCAAMNFPISNNSWGGGGYSKALKDVIQKAGDKGQLFCAAAGNSGSDNDRRPHYPSNYDCANVISVAASDSNDKLAYFSCYGKTTVDIAAPGVNILNLLPNNRIGNLSGTSMATPHVAGAAALILSQNPSAGHQDMKNILMNTVDPIAAFKGKMVAEGRLNLLKVVEATGSKWLSVSPSQGTVGVGKEVRINVNVDATQLVAGQRKAIVAFSTNDPTAKTIELPVNVNVTGEPEMELSAKSFNFGEVWVNQRKEVKLTIRNKGTDTLRISSFTTGNSAFGTNLKSLEVAAKTVEEIVLFASPKQSGNVKSNLTIVSNDPDQRNVSVTLEVKGVTPPSLAINPISIEYKLEPNQKGEKQITISNSGQATGSWNAKIVELDKKRSRTHDMNSLIAGLNADGRAPEYTEPGNPLVDFGASSGNNKSHKNAHRFEGANTKNGLEVAVLGAEQSSTLINFGKELAKKNMISGVTTINVQSLVPKKNELAAFDSIIVYSNFAYRNRNDLGNAISTYAKNGGGVVTMNGENVYFANSENWSLGGNWRSENYSIFSIQKRYSRDKSEIGEIKLPSHPLMQEVKSLSGSLRILHQSPETGSRVAALWRDGTPLVTFRESPASVVDLNFFPTHGAWDAKTDGVLLITNALEWAAQGGAPKWITGNPLAGTVKGGDTNLQKLSFDATSLDEGNYTAEVQFTTNDPKNPYQAVKVKLIVRENQAPIANSQTITLNEDNRVAFEIKAKDEDGDKLSYSIVDQPKNGTLGGKAPNLTYTPKPNFNGTDTLSFKAFDGRKYSNIAKVTFQIKAVNDAPWAQSSEVNASEDEFFAIDFKYGDPDGDKLELTFTKSPKHGLVWNEFGEWYYLPDNHYNGKDSISFTVTDGKLTSQQATVTINLEATNDAPIANNLNVVTRQNKPVSIELNATDIDGDTLAYNIVTDPKHGTLEQKSSSQWTFNPFSEYVGEDTFTYRAKDSEVAGNIGVVTIKILETNRSPVVQAASFSVVEDGKLPIKLSASDPDGDKLTFSITKSPAQGKLTGIGPSYQYTPNKDFNGVDSFMVVANDGELDSNATLISLKIEGKNDLPKFVQSLGTLSQGLRETPFRMNLEVEDADNDELTLTIAKGPQNGDCYFDEQSLVYLPKPGFEGLEEIVLELSDGKESVQNTFPISIASHQNPIHIHFDESQNADLVNMLYQANEVLASNAERILELSAETKENSLKAKYAETLGQGAMDLSTWIEQLSSGEMAGEFEFSATENQNGLLWKVAPFWAPASSVDTKLNNKSSSADNESEQVLNNNKPTTSNKTEESSEEELASSVPVISSDENEEEVSSGNETNIDSKEETNEVVLENKEPTVIASNDNSSEDQNKKVTSEESISDKDTTEVKAKTEEKVASSFITELGSGWYEAPGIGTFYDAGNGWIYEPNMGWSFLKTCPSNCSAWLFNENLGWLWFDAELPNMAFANNNGSPSWIFYPETTFGQSDLVFDYTQNSWMEWK